MADSRIPEIDTAKGIGILLVVFTHIYTFEPFHNIVFSFHMPLFFLMSGLLFTPEHYRTFGIFMKRKFTALIRPYLFFAFLSILWKIIDCIFAHYPIKDILHNCAVDIFYVLFAPSKMAVNRALWFVPCLFVMETLFFFIIKIYKKGHTVCFFSVIALIVVLGWIMGTQPIRQYSGYLPWNITTVCFAMSFFVTGYFCKSFIKEFFDGTVSRKNKIITYCIIVILFLISIPVAIKNAPVSLGDRKFGNGFLLYYTGLSGSAFVFLLASILYKNSFIRYCGQNSFTIMAVHLPVYFALSLVWSVINSHFIAKIVTYNYSFIWQCISFIATMVGSICFSAIYNNFKYKLKKEGK